MAIRNKLLLWTVAGIGAYQALKAVRKKQRKLNFRGKNVVITGGSRGLGLELARLLAQEGANLALCAREADELARAKTELSAWGGQVVTYPCDVTDKAQLDGFVQQVVRELGTIDVLINNAGIISVIPYANTTEADFRQALDTHLWAPFHLINAVLPIMRARRVQDAAFSGRIVNIASIGGKVAVPHLLPYSTSKFALVGYSEGLRMELQKENILVTTVCPGLMRTGSPRNAIVGGQNEKEYAAFKISDSLPLVTTDSTDAARQIVEACRYGVAEKLITFPTKLATTMQALTPELLAETMALANWFLPEPGGIGTQRVHGKDSESAVSESFLTTLTDEAAARNNEL